MDERFSPNHSRSARQYVTHGSTGCARVADRDLRAIWTGCFRKLSGGHKSVAFAGALAIALALIAFAQASHFEQPLNRWQSVSEHIPNDARWQASRVAMRALPDIGLFGFGPGTFRVVFPIYNMGSDQVPGAGDFCTRITCRPYWNGDGLEAFFGRWSFLEE